MIKMAVSGDNHLWLEIKILDSTGDIIGVVPGINNKGL